MSQLINEIKQDLHGVKNPKSKKEEKKSMTLMEMVFNNNMNPQEIDNPGYDTATLPNEPTDNDQTQQGSDMQPMQGQLPSEQINDPEIQSILANIRLAVIKGLAKLAEKPQTIEYDTLKRILTIVDKPIEAQKK